jgi:hypothetical protein
MKILQFKSDLNNLIKDKIEEGSELEYKSSGALDKSDKKKSEIAKDVSAMANASGGTVIYGIKESKHVPQKITPINRDDFSKEWLEQIINSNISPKIAGLKITSISVDDESGVVYVVNIPQGNTAHQNSYDCKYHRRYNFEILAMKDYEIRDAMNRTKHPTIELQFEIEVVDEGRELGVQSSWKGVFDLGVEIKENTYLVLRPLNKGGVYANFVNYFVELPVSILSLENVGHLKRVSEESVEFYGENTFRDISGSGINRKYGPSRFDPILPSLHGRSEKILLLQNVNFGNCEIKW